MGIEETRTTAKTAIVTASISAMAGIAVALIGSGIWRGSVSSKPADQVWLKIYAVTFDAPEFVNQIEGYRVMFEANGYGYSYPSSTLLQDPKTEARMEVFLLVPGYDDYRLDFRLIAKGYDGLEYHFQASPIQLNKGSDVYRKQHSKLLINPINKIVNTNLSANVQFELRGSSAY
ncbi:MAG: hypothetical protein ACRERE_05325 [Candidatus Entotheonellia bacterium]